MSQSAVAEAEPLTLVSPAPTRSKRPRGSRSAALERSRPLFLPLLVGFVAALGGATPGIYALQRQSAIREELGGLRRHVEKGMQQLDAGIHFDSRRRRLLLGIRDEIMAANARLGPGLAYEYASHLVSACEKYPKVDPVLLLAIGIVESGFDASARSHARAHGLYQILPSTGRMLAGMLGWQFGEELLREPAKNTALAALYLHVLFTTYDDESLVLAEYNGGPLNAGYIRAGGAKASPETRSYVTKVLGLRQRLARAGRRRHAARHGRCGGGEPGRGADAVRRSRRQIDRRRQVSSHLQAAVRLRSWMRGARVRG
jgi:hypothetical protein